MQYQSLIQQIWDEMATNPHKAVDDATRVLHEIKTLLQKQSTTARSGALALQELEALHLVGFASFNVANYTRVQEIADELLTKAQHQGITKYVHYAELLQAKLFLQKGQYDTAKNLYQQLKLAFESEQDYFYLQAVFIDTSLIEMHANNYQPALEYLHQAEKLCTAYNVKVRVQIVILTNIATIYNRIGNSQKALEYAQQISRTAVANNLHADHTSALLLISNTYGKLGNAEHQHSTLAEAINISEQHQLLSINAKCRVALSQFYVNKEEFAKATKELTLAEGIFKQTEDSYSKAVVHMRFMNIYGNTKNSQFNIKTARQYYNLSQQYSIDKKMPHFQSAIVKEWSAILASAGLFEDAYQAHITSTELAHQVINEQSVDKLKHLEVQYDVLLKEKENQLLNSQKQTLEVERNHLQNQLTMKTNSMLEQLKAVNQLRTEVLEIVHQIDTAESILVQIKRKLNTSTILRQDWNAFTNVFNSVHPMFEKELVRRYPSLTKMEIRICLLARTGMSTDEMAQLLCISDRTIEAHRLRLRKKLNLKRNESIVALLASL